MSNLKLYSLVVIDEAQDNKDGTYTTAEVHNAKYPGGTNQVKAEKIIFKGKEYLILTEYI